MQDARPSNGDEVCISQQALEVCTATAAALLCVCWCGGLVISRSWRQRSKYGESWQIDLQGPELRLRCFWQRTNIDTNKPMLDQRESEGVAQAKKGC